MEQRKIGIERHTSELWAMSILDQMLTDLENSDELFKPTNFWKCGLPEIITDLKTQGFFNFKSHASARSWYYGYYANSEDFQKGRLAKSIRSILLNSVLGQVFSSKYCDLRAALTRCYRSRRDYRSFRSTTLPSPPHLEELSESPVGHPYILHSINGRNYSLSFLNYLRGLNFLKKCSDLSQVKDWLEIGGGHGCLGEILLKVDREMFYLNVDIPPLAAVSTFYLSEIFGRESVLAYDQSRDLKTIELKEIKKHYRCAVILPWQLPLVRGDFDVFVNFVSFQEMEPEVVRNYVNIVTPLIKGYVLLRNSKHGKPIAQTAGQIGVLRAITTDQMIELFRNFSVMSRDDSNLYAFRTRNDSFISEVICLAKKNSAHN